MSFCYWNQESMKINNCPSFLLLLSLCSAEQIKQLVLSPSARTKHQWKIVALSFQLKNRTFMVLAQKSAKPIKAFCRNLTLATWLRFRRQTLDRFFSSKLRSTSSNEKTLDFLTDRLKIIHSVLFDLIKMQLLGQFLSDETKLCHRCLTTFPKLQDFFLYSQSAHFILRV